MRILSKILLILPFLILFILPFLVGNEPRTIQEVPSKIKESVEDLGRSLTQGFSNFFKLKNETNKTQQNETGETEGFIPSLNQQTLVARKNPSMKLEISDILCNHYFKIFVKNVGNVDLNFSNPEFYYKDKDYRLEVNLSFNYLEPEEEGVIFIPLSGGIPLPQREPWHIEMILKDEKNNTFFDSTFLVFCVL